MRGLNLLILTLIFWFATVNTFAQTSNDTIPKKQSLSLTAGVSLPLSTYMKTSVGGGYAVTGLAIQSRYTYEIIKSLSLEANYTFFANGINTDAIAKTNKSTIENQIGKEVRSSTASGNFWNTHSLMLGANYKLNLSTNKKLSANIGFACGSALVSTPASETIASVNSVFYQSTTKRSQNLTFAYQGLVGLSYQIKPKTSFAFNIGYIGMDLKGYNLNITDVGNNSYNQSNYKFEQKISALNITIGLSTHF